MVEESSVRADRSSRRWPERPAGRALPPPAGAFYAFPNVSGTGMTGTEFADRMLKDAGVSVLGGNAFGRVGVDHVRVSYANSQENLRRALERMADVLAATPVA